MNPNIIINLLSELGRTELVITDKNLVSVLRDIAKGDNTIKWFIAPQEDILFVSKSDYLRSECRRRERIAEQENDRGDKALLIGHYQALIKAGFPANVAQQILENKPLMAKLLAEIYTK